MNYTEFIAATASKAAITKKDAKEVIGAVVDVIKETLATGEEIKFSDLGKFEVVDRAARVGRNPATGSEIEIPASKAPKFKAGKALKSAVNA